MPGTGLRAGHGAFPCQFRAWTGGSGAAREVGLSPRSALGPGAVGAAGEPGLGQERSQLIPTPSSFALNQHSGK